MHNVFLCVICLYTSADYRWIALCGPAGRLLSINTTDLYNFLSRYCTTYSQNIFITQPLTAQLSKWRQVPWNGTDVLLYRCVDVSTQQISRIVVKQMFNMFNIIKTLQNSFACELLPYNLSSEVALYFSISQWRPYLVVSCSEEVFLLASAAPVINTYLA